MSNKISKEELQQLAISPESILKYTNGEITVFWFPDKCIHSANCLLELPEVFDTSHEPWISMDGAPTEDIIRTVNTCPSKALCYKMDIKIARRQTKKKKKKPAISTHIELVKDGPALIRGSYIIRDANKKKVKIEGEVAAICRCGKTKHSPFCDGSHKTAGFRDRS